MTSPTLTLLMTLATVASSADITSTKISETNDVSEISNLGFGPALYLIRFNKDTVDNVRVDGAGNLNADKSRMLASMGLEVHYTFLSGPFATSYFQSKDGNKVSTSGYSISPYVGVFDLTNGINGLSTGLVFSLWRGNSEGENKRALNMGVGYSVYKNQTVLSDGFSIGSKIPTGTQLSDATTKADIDGINILVSASLGF